MIAIVLMTVLSLFGVNIPECATEDSSYCYWDGGSNGKGDQFIDWDGKKIVIWNG